MGSFSVWHWLLVLAIVLVVFGTKKLRGAGGDLGAGIRDFQKALKSGEAEAEARVQKVVSDDQKA